MGSITRLESNAPVPESGLKGGNFTYDYNYDHLYRLTGAGGTYRGASHEHRYELSMSYGTTGAIHNKNQLHQFRGYDDEQWAPRHKTTYNWDYEYNSTQSHAPSQIGELKYSYDANGNPTGWQSTQNNQRRDILWDEENRMRAIANNGVTHHYMYDASGERVIKSTGDGQTIYINGFPMGGSGVAGNYTMYVNPFMVVNNMKFTKHYYMGNQRVVSKLGEMGAHQDMLNPREMKRAGGNTIQWDNKEMKQKEQLIANFLALGLDGMLFTAGKSGKIPYGQIKKYFRHGGTLPEGSDQSGSNKPGKPETLQFFYHPDHLGSSSFITDVSGEVYQHIQYFPFGETFVEERTGTRYTPYLYNGKELDEETGLYYYGARYYDPRISMFYGVDPLAEKYPGFSSFAYCLNNPLFFVDPDGRAVKPSSANAFNIILWGLTPKEAKYLRLDANGLIDADYLRQGKNNLETVGENYQSLLILAENERIIEVHASSSFETSEGMKNMGHPTYESVLDVMYDLEGKAFGMTKEEYSKAKPEYSGNKEWSGWFGIALFPDEGSQGTSTSGNMQVIVNDNPLKTNPILGARKMTSTFAHEAYGHILFKILGLPYGHGNIKSLTSNSPNNNRALEIQIYNRENEAEKNFDLHHR